MVVDRSSTEGHIVRHPRVLGDEPIVRGTRISVRNVILAAREYGAPKGVVDAYPQLTAADVDDALRYDGTHTIEIDEYSTANLDD